MMKIERRKMMGATDRFPVLGSKLEGCDATWFSPSFSNDWMPQLNEN